MLQNDLRQFNKVESVAIFGSTGFIGKQTLDVIRRCGDINVFALTCDTNVDVLINQID